MSNIKMHMTAAEGVDIGKARARFSFWHPPQVRAVFSEITTMSLIELGEVIDDTDDARLLGYFEKMKGFYCKVGIPFHFFGD